MTDIIQLAAAKLVLEGLAAAELSGFVIRSPSETKFVVVGPHNHYDIKTKRNGIWIHVGDTNTTVHVNPFPQFNEHCSFEHNNPNFPDNLIHYLEETISSWQDWNEVFRRDESHS